MFPEILPFHYIQKQPSTDVLQNRFSENFRSIRGKASVLEALFNEIAGLQALFKRDSGTVVFL